VELVEVDDSVLPRGRVVLVVDVLPIESFFFLSSFDSIESKFEFRVTAFDLGVASSSLGILADRSILLGSCDPGDTTMEEVVDEDDDEESTLGEGCGFGIVVERTLFELTFKFAILPIRIVGRIS